MENCKYKIKTIFIQIPRYRLTVNKFRPRNEALVSRHQNQQISAQICFKKYRMYTPKLNN